MDCWRQWVRHRTASINEYSTRYSIAIDSAQTTGPNAWRKQSAGNRQGSDGVFSSEEGAQLSSDETALHRQVRQTYRRRIEAGVAREQARKDLLLSTYTEAYWKIDLHNLLHFLHLRMDDHAQQEINHYARAIGHEIVRPLFPVVWEAFIDYRVDAMRLTRLDQEVIARLSSAGRVPATETQFLEAQHADWTGLKRCRERDECREKLKRLGLLR
jgi:thymidylate synthase (FAD)